MQLLRLRSRTCSSRRTSPPNSAKVIRFKAPVDVGRACRDARPMLARLQGSAEAQITGGMPALRRMLVAILTTAGIAIFTPAVADDTGSSFAGKTVRVVVGFSPGGGYDIYARELARYLGRHIPGHPAVVVQNMAGAGSLKAVNFLFNAAPRDGTVLATFSRGIVFEPLIGHLDGAQFDAPKFNWIGSIADEVGVCAINASRGIATWQDMLTTRTVIGASGAGADSDAFPIVLRNLFHLPMRVVTGYPGGADVNLAMERGEVDGRCGWSWTSILSRNREWLNEKRIRITLQIALAKHEDLPDVPLITDLVSDPRQAAAVRLIVSRQGIARPFAAPPDVPPERIATLREAFDATMRDPDFIAEMRSQALDVRPLGGGAVQALMRDIYASPPDVVKLARELLADTP
jgi:tripartite-type tricarboxylate transporter receptor subunit TctC